MSLLILGSGRSGTTFLARLIDCSPEVLYRHEPDFTLVSQDIPFFPEQRDFVEYGEATSKYYRSLESEKSFKTSGQPPIFRKQYRSSATALVRKLLVYVSKIRNSKLVLGNSIPDLVADKHKPRILIKSVNSVGRSGLFLESLEDLQTVHIVRHPCAVVASTLEGSKRGLMSTDVYIDSLFAIDNIDSFGYTRSAIERLSLEEQLAFQWMVTNEKAFIDSQKYDTRYYLLSYENLCLNLEQESRSLYDFYQLAWSEYTTQFISRLNGSDDKAGEYFSVARHPTASLSKWKTSLRPEVQENIISLVRNSQVGDFACSSANQRP